MSLYGRVFEIKNTYLMYMFFIKKTHKTGLANAYFQKNTKKFEH